MAAGTKTKSEVAGEAPRPQRPAHETWIRPHSVHQGIWSVVLTREETRGLGDDWTDDDILSPKFLSGKADARFGLRQYDQVWVRTDTKLYHLLIMRISPEGEVAAVHTALLQPPFDLVAARKNMKNVDWSVAEVQELADGRAQIIAPDYLRSGGNKVLVKGSLASVEAAHQYIKEKRVAALY